MMDFVFKMMDFVFKMMDFVFKMMDFVFKNHPVSQKSAMIHETVSRQSMIIAEAERGRSSARELVDHAKASGQSLTRAQVREAVEDLEREREPEREREREPEPEPAGGGGGEKSATGGFKHLSQAVAAPRNQVSMTSLRAEDPPAEDCSSETDDEKREKAKQADAKNLCKIRQNEGDKVRFSTKKRSFRTKNDEFSLINDVL